MLSVLASTALPSQALPSEFWPWWLGSPLWRLSQQCQQWDALTLPPVRPHKGSGVLLMFLTGWSSSSRFCSTSFCPGWAAELSQSCPWWGDRAAHLGPRGVPPGGGGDPRDGEWLCQVWTLPCIRVGAVGPFWPGLITPSVLGGAGATDTPGVLRAVTPDGISTGTRAANPAPTAPAMRHHSKRKGEGTDS